MPAFSVGKLLFKLVWEKQLSSSYCFKNLHKSINNVHWNIQWCEHNSITVYLSIPNYVCSGTECATSWFLPTRRPHSAVFAMAMCPSVCPSVCHTRYYTNWKSYVIYRMVPLSMTLSDLWPGFQGHNIFWSRISEKMARLKDSYYCTRGNYT